MHYSTDASADGSPLMTTASYLATEEAEAVKCQEMFEVVRKYETLHTNTWQVGVELAVRALTLAQVQRPSAAADLISLQAATRSRLMDWLRDVQVLSTEAQSYLARHKQLVQAVLHASARIGLSDQVTGSGFASPHAVVLGRLRSCSLACRRDLPTSAHQAHVASTTQHLSMCTIQQYNLLRARQPCHTFCAVAGGACSRCAHGRHGGCRWPAVRRVGGAVHCSLPPHRSGK